MAWLDNAWAYRVKITTLAAKVDADLTGFPVYVDLSDLPAGFHANCNQTDARDIRVTTSDGTTEVPREVVWYDAATDTGELYFKGTIGGDTNTDFYIYYGNAAAADYAVTATNGARNVWSATYALVYHLHGNTTNSAAATSNGTDTSMQYATANGKFGQGAAHDATGGHYSVIGTGLNTVMQGSWTISMWATAAGTTENRVVIACDNNTGVRQFTLSIVGTNRYIYFERGGTPIFAGNTGLKMATTFKLLHVMYDGTHLSDYINGVVSQQEIDMTALASSANSMYLGKRQFSGSEIPHVGNLDEVRVASSALSATWASTEFNNQNSPDTFFTIGTQETSTTIKKIAGTAQASVKKVLGTAIASVKKIGGVA